MEPYIIEAPFVLAQQSTLTQDSFEEADMFPMIRLAFPCFETGKPVDVELKPFAAGKPLFQLYRKASFINEEALLKAKVGFAPRRPGAPLEVRGLGLNYVAGTCGPGKTPFILVFGMGETQPGRMQCLVTGVWRIIPEGDD